MYIRECFESTALLAKWHFSLETGATCCKSISYMYMYMYYACVHQFVDVDILYIGLGWHTTSTYMYMCHVLCSLHGCVHACRLLNWSGGQRTPSPPPPTPAPRRLTLPPQLVRSVTVHLVWGRLVLGTKAHRLALLLKWGKEIYIHVYTCTCTYT